MNCILSSHMKAVYVIQISVPGFGDYGKRPPIILGVGFATPHLPANDRVTHYADAVCIRDHDRTVDKSGVFDPMRSRHFAIAIQAEKAAEDSISRIFAARQNRGHAGAYRANASFEWAVPGNQRRVSNLHALDVGNGIEGAGIAVKSDAEIAGPGLHL